MDQAMFVRGTIRKIVMGKPYNTRAGVEKVDYEIDLDLDTQRFPFTVKCSQEFAGHEQVGQKVEYQLNYKTLQTKDGKPFSIFRVIES